ncbi:MAG TPA: dephospho-CoA kinase [Gammaproteobacteria bacterium]|nr:dephospho-CoA kinase [Gammaproteobacteria bacterium]|tara:strand:- start:1166 stop:1768 length:603 start_codon:yes stop_codon:yes gene_type:complete
MFVVGIAGGIGSGKTTISDRLSELGVSIADADVASRTIVEPGTPALAEIVARHGQRILAEDGTLDRSQLRTIVFRDTAERKWLEKLTHGPINAELRRTMEQSTSSYSALILSAGAGRSPIMNRLLVVDVPPDLQIKRVTTRDNNTRQQVQAIMDVQPTREQRLRLADDILVNDGTLEQLIARVDQLHAKYVELSETSGYG